MNHIPTMLIANFQFSPFNFQLKKGCYPYKSNTPIMHYEL